MTYYMGKRDLISSKQVTNNIISFKSDIYNKSEKVIYNKFAKSDIE